MANHQYGLAPDGRFTLVNPDGISHLYLPLFSESGMKSAITPHLGGDLKIDQNHFASAPVWQDTMDTPDHTRNVFFNVDGVVYNVTGNTPTQKLVPDRTNLEIGLLDQTIRRENALFAVTVTSFVPALSEHLELHRVVFTNHSGRTLSVHPIIAFPLYGRSADNLRDHRHVTSLLNRVHVLENGVVNVPTLSFDERGHLANHTAYGVFAVSDRHPGVEDRWPVREEFVGEGGDMFLPAATLTNVPSHRPGTVAAGYEALGGLGFATIALPADGTLTLVAGYVIADTLDQARSIAAEKITIAAFDPLLAATRRHWEGVVAPVAMRLSSPERAGWLRWVGLQPVMRRIYGCSFLPHHDYGRGGRGWRDLWQDSLALTLLDPASVRDGIVNNLRGIRIDGSNATIVGLAPGEFVADRNNIVRVWSDHGAWPLVTIDFYAERTGDLDVYFTKIPYWHDKFTHYTKGIDARFDPAQGNLLKGANGVVYEGTVLEHLLLENVIPFYNVGVHGCVRLEDADWNDGLDMAGTNGETVPFTAMYAGNLAKLADLIDRFRKVRGLQYVEIPKEAAVLFGTLDRPLVGDSAQLTAIRDAYFAAVASGFSGETVKKNLIDLVGDLRGKSKHWKKLLNDREWIEAGGGLGWYNGYYDDHGKRSDNAGEDLRMTLTAQVFPLLAGLVPAERVPKIAAAVRRHLTDAATGLVRLNTDLAAGNLKLGRFAGFAYGHKENGAFFSHMAVMYAYGLFVAGFASEGSAVLDRQYAYMADVDRCRILPGIPEYVDPHGRGVYHYLTGSAAWTIITHVERLFGIRGAGGDFLIEPKLGLAHFDEGEAACAFVVGAKTCRLVVKNPDRLEVGRYVVKTVEYEGKIHEVGAPAFSLSRKECEKGITVTALLGKAV